MVECYGRDPRSEAGRCHQASPWSWSALVQLVGVANLRAGGKLLPNDALERMGGCGGAVLTNQAACDALARELTRMLEQPCRYQEHGLQLLTGNGEQVIAVPGEDGGLLVDPGGRVYATGAVPESTVKAMKLKSVFRVRVADVQRFVTFLRNADGFMVT